MIRFILVMGPLVFLINGLTKHDWLEALLFAVAVTVGLTPEMLPMIVTVNLAKGAVAMARAKVIVKRLNAIQNLGAMDLDPPKDSAREAIARSRAAACRSRS
jgi:Mg2+-importing ATPase